MSSATVEKYNDEPTVKPLSHSDRYGPAMVKIGYDQSAAQERAEQNIKDAAKMPTSLSKLNERLRTGDHTKEANKNTKEMIKGLKEGLRSLSGSKKTQKKVKG